MNNLFGEFPCHCPVACTDSHEKQGGRTGKLLKIGLGNHRVNKASNEQFT